MRRFRGFYSRTKIQIIGTDEISKRHRIAPHSGNSWFSRESSYSVKLYKRSSGRIDRELVEARWHRNGRLCARREIRLWKGDERRCILRLLFPRLPSVYSKKETLYRITSDPWDLFDCLFGAFENLRCRSFLFANIAFEGRTLDIRGNFDERDSIDSMVSRRIPFARGKIKLDVQRIAIAFITIVLRISFEVTDFLLIDRIQQRLFIRVR